MDTALVMSDSPSPTLAAFDSEALPSEKPPTSRKRLKPHEIARIVVLQQEGLSPFAIAQRIGRHHTTVKTCLDSLQDSRDAAKAILSASAAGMAQRIAEKARPEACIDVLERLDVLRPKQSAGAGAGVQILVGVAALPGLPSGQVSVSNGQVKALPELTGCTTNGAASAQVIDSKDSA